MCTLRVRVSVRCPWPCVLVSRCQFAHAHAYTRAPPRERAHTRSRGARTVEEGRRRGQGSIVEYRIPAASLSSIHIYVHTYILNIYIYYIGISARSEQETSFYVPMTLTYQFPEFQFPNLYGRRTGRDKIYWPLGGRFRALPGHTRNEEDSRGQLPRRPRRWNETERNGRVHGRWIDRFNKNRTIDRPQQPGIGPLPAPWKNTVCPVHAIDARRWWNSENASRRDGTSRRIALAAVSRPRQRLRKESEAERKKAARNGGNRLVDEPTTDACRRADV